MAPEMSDVTRRRKRTAPSKKSVERHVGSLSAVLVLSLCIAVAVMAYPSVPEEMADSRLELVSIAGTVGSISFVVMASALWNGKRGLGRLGAAAGWLATVLLMLAATAGLTANAGSVVWSLLVFGLGALTIFICLQVGKIDEE